MSLNTDALKQGRGAVCDGIHEGYEKSVLYFEEVEEDKAWGKSGARNWRKEPVDAVSESLRREGTGGRRVEEGAPLSCTHLLCDESMMSRVGP